MINDILPSEIDFLDSAANFRILKMSKTQNIFFTLSINALPVSILKCCSEILYQDEADTTTRTRWDPRRNERMWLFLRNQARGGGEGRAYPSERSVERDSCS